jgi:hypothetical protein
MDQKRCSRNLAREKTPARKSDISSFKVVSLHRNIRAKMIRRLEDAHGQVDVEVGTHSEDS